MSLNTILATTPLTSTGYHLKATGTTIGNSLIWDNGTNVGIGNTNTSYTLDVTGTLRNTTSAYFATASGNIGIGTASPVSTNLVGSQTIVKSYNSDTPTSTTAQTYYTNQSNLYLFGRNAGLSIICPATNEEGSIFFGNSLSVAYASINTGSGTTSVGGDMNFRVGSNTERMRITSGGVVTVNQALSTYGAMAVKGNTDVYTYGGFNIYNNTNINFISIAINTTRAVIGADYSAGGSYMPLCFETGNTERMRISSNGLVTMPYQPAFSVANGAASTGPGIVPIKNIVFDDGNNFNTSTYRFTAPVTGRYFFSYYCNVLANSTAAAIFRFRVNGTVRGAFYYNSTKTNGLYYMVSFQQVIKLDAGDYVDVYNASVDSPDYSLTTADWGNFSGNLIG